MKKLLFSLVVFSVLFITGCQENSLTDPFSNESPNKMQSAGGEITHGSIPLEGILEVQGSDNLYNTINGRINYIHEIVQVDPSTTILC